MFALNRLSIHFADRMKHRFDMPLIRSPSIGVKLGDAERFKERFQFEKCSIFVVCQHIRQYGSRFVVNGVPQPPLLSLGTYKAPHFIEFCLCIFPPTKIYEGLSWL